MAKMAYYKRLFKYRPMLRLCRIPALMADVTVSSVRGRELERVEPAGALYAP